MRILLLFLYDLNFRPLFLAVTLVAGALVLSGCASQEALQAEGGIYDPYEEDNRQTHAFNKAADKYLVDPLSQGYGNSTSGGVREVVGNFSSHLSLPNDVINNVLQGDFGYAAQNTGRFLLNTFVGFAGFLDPAEELNMPRVRADFGQTLHVWGAGEGAYVELPFWGPSTSRDTVGIFVDLALDPFFVVLRSPETYIGGVAYILDAMGSRYTFDATVDSVLYDSADSYAQARSIYLQNRRYELGITGEDLYLDPYSDPYSDPYEDF
ncbi:VacJ family lipoprotein [uncultured Shimia sp.]|uniref:MlaA family lipoprotein n=1 Tax=uncultured Shimia sp. TaxID=573152 RepID=UPI00262E5290|nr:VacJ family lipoprotein [uncultured Shimia sp.]